MYSVVSSNSEIDFMQNDEFLRIRLNADLKAELQKLADKDNRKLSDFIRLELIKLVEKPKKKN